MTRPTIRITALKGCLPAKTSTQTDVLVRIQGPEPERDSKRRLRLNLSLVLDRSGSMTGRPLAEAKACAKRIVTGLAAGDRVSVVAYDGSVTMVVPSTLATDTGAICRAIDRIGPGGMTNLHGGWIAGAEQVAEFLTPDSLGRVMLLSDGQTNQGVTNPEEITRQCALMAEKGVTTSTCGLGNNFNEDLMAGMAKSGLGQAYYGETADDLAPNFEAEFGILAATCGRNVQLSVTPAEGVKVQMLNPYQARGDASWALPNIVHGAETWALLRLDVSPKAKGETHLFDTRLEYADVEGAPQPSIVQSFSLPVVAKKAYSSAQEDAAVAERAKEIRAAEIQVEAKNAAATGRWEEVDSLIGTLRGLAGDNAWIAGTADSLQEFSQQRNANLLSKQAVYGAAAMSARYADADEDVTSLASTRSFTTRHARQGKTRAT